VCIRHIDRVFQLIPVDDASFIYRFDLDFCQVALTGSTMIITPACVRAHATRVCRVGPSVTPVRQHKAVRKGFGLYVEGEDVLNNATFWDRPRVYVPGSDLPEQIQFNMMLNLGCQRVTSDIAEIMDVVNTTDTHNGPEYLPVDTHQSYTASAYLACESTILELSAGLPEARPDGAMGYNLPFTLVFQKQMWVYHASCESLELRDPSRNHTAPGRDEILQFTQRVQRIVDALYGNNTCWYGFEDKHFLTLNVTPSSRILDVHARAPVSLADMRDSCVCTAVRCSTIVIGDTWWAPAFVCQDIDVFPREMALR
jgi:hypothetical protein